MTLRRSGYVYLAGGFHSGWQDRVKGALSELHFFDPREHKLDDPVSYTRWDLEAIRKSDWMLAYLEETNPGGYALALELGFAKALGKGIVLIDEMSLNSPAKSKQLAMLHVCADACCASLEEGISYLRAAI